MNSRFLFLPLFLALLAPLPLTADEDMMKTDWLHLIEGYQGEAVGAQMRKVETDERTGEQKLTISIPKISITDPSQMEEVVVVGQAPEERKPLFNFKYETEWVDDYDSNHYGLVVRLGKGSNWPIRLFMHADNGPKPYRDLTDP
jgi:hypothetical protein